MNFFNDFLKKPKSLIYIISLAFIIRLLWILIVKTVPTSDFKLMYDTSQFVANGNYSSFYGHNYFALFPHDSITVLYFSLFFKVLTNPLFLVKFMNIIYETLSVYIIYLIGKNTYNEKIGEISAILMAFFPPFIMYCSETMAENMAIPLFLISIYLFIKYIDNDSIFILFLSGIFLSLGDLFRPVGIVFFIAYIIYYVIKKVILEKKKYLVKFSCVIILIIGCLLPTVIISNTLASSGIIENQLWSAGEPAIMTILKGTNVESIGAWTESDSALPKECNYNKELITKKAIERIEDTFKTHTPLQIIEFYCKKIFLQWGIGDFGAYEWTVATNPGVLLSLDALAILTPIVYILISLYYIFLIILSIRGLFNLRVQRNSKLMFYYLILLGFIGFYLLTERQARYAFVCCWLFILTASNAFCTAKKTNKKATNKKENLVVEI